MEMNPLSRLSLLDFGLQLATVKLHSYIPRHRVEANNLARRLPFTDPTSPLNRLSLFQSHAVYYYYSEILFTHGNGNNNVKQSVAKGHRSMLGCISTVCQDNIMFT